MIINQYEPLGGMISIPTQQLLVAMMDAAMVTCVNIEAVHQQDIGVLVLWSMVVSTRRDWP